jgi:DNA-binding protein, stimulates sugar fermentation
MDVFISPAAAPGRKLPYTLELVRPCGDWIGVNTLTPNRLLKKAWEAGVIPELRGYKEFCPKPCMELRVWMRGFPDRTGNSGSRPKT